MSRTRKDTVLRASGLKDLIIDAVEGTTNIVERTQESVTARYVDPLLALEPIADEVRLVDAVRRLGTASVYTTIRLVNRGVGLAADAGIAIAETAILAAERVDDQPQDAERDIEKTEDGAETTALVPRRRKSSAVGWFADAAQGALNGF